uniref:Protein kinase domain-containing protein n=1 Tax=Salmo trutta TaxID=8032 RepID=A0A673Y3B3_SALTR
MSWNRPVAALLPRSDKFGRMYKPLSPTEIGRRWSIYTNISGPTWSKCEFDIEDLVSRLDIVLGRGGFGVTVKVNDHLVAKTNLFPEMVDWSVPFIDNEFSRYAHIASQVEEVMIGEFMWRIQNTSVVPMVELDTLRGLEYFRSRTIQHRDFTHRNVLVCHQPDRKAIPFAFKISEFGTSCNFSTPDQPRGNRTNMAPEVLWYSPNSVYAFLLQVFLTLKATLDTRLLPTHMTEWRYILIGKGAVMIDIVPYLSRNFNKQLASMFSDQCKNLTSLCTTMVAKHLPNSNVCKWLCNLSTGTSTSQVLTDSI